MIGYYFTKDSAKIRLFFGFTKLFLFNYIFLWRASPAAIKRITRQRSGWQCLYCDFGGAVAAVVGLVVEDAELAGGDAVDGGGWVDYKSILRCLFQGAGDVFGGVADFEGDGGWPQCAGDMRRPSKGVLGEPVEVVDGKILLVGGGGVVAVGDVEDVVGDVFFDDEPGPPEKPMPLRWPMVWNQRPLCSPMRRPVSNSMTSPGFSPR